MNVTELARKLKVSSEELLEKLPKIGFDIGKKAIKVNPKEADRIMRGWNELKRREEIEKRYREEREMEEKKKLRAAGILPTKSITMPAVITVRDFAGKVEMPVNELMKVLMKNGILASMNERIDISTASIIAEDLGFKVTQEANNTNTATDTALDQLKTTLEAADEKKVARPPVVVIMGHVDHGKTTLLDSIRKTDVVSGEAGGITQHIGAYQVVKKNRRITFIDTPGHEAFSVMRSRGAKVADIAVLVVAADDSVQPQTKEAIGIIKAAGIPMIVAINKIDKPDANIEKTKTMLTEAGVLLEGWGGNTPVVEVSAKKNINIDGLLDVILLVADFEKERISANPDRRAIGTVIESNVSKGEGPVATLLVQAGTLHAHDALGLNGQLYGKVRAMKDWHGELVDVATPGMPVKILGFKVAPAVGDIVEVPENIKDLESPKLRSQQVIESLSAAQTVQAEGGEEANPDKKYLNLVIRTDVLGSLEAIVGKLEKVNDRDIQVRVIGKGLGNITETDVDSAISSGAIIYGFNVRPNAKAAVLARDKNVTVNCYKIIYELFDDVQKRLNEIVAPQIIKTDLGNLEVLAFFKKDGNEQVVGALVKKGKILGKCRVRIFRAGTIIGEGDVVELRSGKQIVTECRQSEQCGIRISTRTKIEVGDILESFSEEKKIKKVEVK
ncbi:MAG: translation initiation factor IF-2 [bacterium]